jgi:hypothetical protein
MSDPELKVVLSDALREFESWWTAEQDAEDVREQVLSPVYHYTDAHGLEGIIRSEELWLTSIQHLNDPTELRYGLGLATEELDQIANDKHKAIQLMCHILKDVMIHRVHLAFDFFVCSLSRNGDDLGQWRGYGDDGRGFAIGLRALQTRRHLQDSHHLSICSRPSLTGGPF